MPTVKLELFQYPKNTNRPEVLKWLQGKEMLTVEEERDIFRGVLEWYIEQLTEHPLEFGLDNIRKDRGKKAQEAIDRVDGYFDTDVDQAGD